MDKSGKLKYSNVFFLFLEVVHFGIDKLKTNFSDNSSIIHQHTQNCVSRHNKAIFVYKHHGQYIESALMTLW